jgi:UMF1 family MFS transporter
MAASVSEPTVLMADTILSERAYRRATLGWSMYDWANSAFATTILASVFQVYYVKVAAPSGWSPTLMWNATTIVAMLLSAMAAPVLGAIGDYTGARKRLLAGFAVVGIFFTATLATITPGEWLGASLLFIPAFIGWAGANVFYDSLLPLISRPRDIDRVSTRGYAMGYLGGGLLLAVDLLMIRRNPAVGVRLSLLSVAVWWAVFMTPLLAWVHEPRAVRAATETRVNPLAAGFARVRRTFGEIRRYRELLKYMFAFWLYNDAINAIILLAASYGKEEMGLSDNHIVGALLLTQFVGVPCAIAFGFLAGRLGTRPSIIAALGVYTLVTVFGYFITQTWHFYALALLVGTVQGGSQALSRSLYGAMAPKAKASEFFGFYDVSSKFAAIVAPTIFLVTSLVANSLRVGILSLSVLFVTGAVMLSRVNIEEGKRVAREEDARAAGTEGT